MAAPKLACTQDAARRYFCIDKNGVRAGTGKHKDIRASRLYTGTPRGVSDSGTRFIADCATRIAVIQDNDGINIGGNRSSATSTARDLTTWLCEAPKPRQDPALRQFGPD